MNTHNTIVLGGVGSGKLNNIQKMLKTKDIPDSDIQIVSLPSFLSSSEFVGDIITNTKPFFQPNVFINSLVKAINKPFDDIYLILDEIESCNLSLVMGEYTSLLPRHDTGESISSIEIDKTIAEYISTTTNKPYNTNLKLPANFYIIGTMNPNITPCFNFDLTFKRNWQFVQNEELIQELV